MTDKYITSEHIDKLGHNIQEIRERALINISSKLDRGFKYDNELARSRELLLKLIDWFKVDPKALRHEAVALNLLKRIIISETGLLLIDLFGSTALIDEFKAIRKVVNEESNPIIEEIVKYLNRTVNIIVPPLDLKEMDSSRSCLSLNRNASERSGNIETTASTIEGFVTSFTSIEVGDNFSQESYQNTSRPVPMKDKSKQSCQVETFKYFTLSWQWLIGADRHVLESVSETLRNPSDPYALLNACDFFTDVLLHDFPAEVFLQRPDIVKQFHDLLWSCPSSRTTTAILKCLGKLTKELITRINYYNDPNTHNLKLNNYHAENITPRNIEEKDEDVESSDRSENENLSETISLMKKQMNLPQYCLNTINSLFDYLYVTPEAGETFRRRKCFTGINTALVLLKDAIILFKMSVRSNIWELEVKKVQYVEITLTKIRDTLCKYGEVLQHFRIKVISEDFNEATRMIQLHLLFNFVHFYLDFIPANESMNILPANLKHALSESILDPSLSILFSIMHEHLLEFTNAFSTSSRKTAANDNEEDALAMYAHVSRICQSMTASIHFLREWKSLPFTKNIDLVKKALESLAFHRNMNLINCFVDLCANKLTMHSFDAYVFEQLDDIFLILLSHDEDDIRLEMYKACQKKVIKTIGAKSNISKSSAPGSQVLFLLRQKVLCHIATHGMMDTNEEVQRYSEDILIHIIKCKILVCNEIWQEALVALIPTFPILLTQVNDQKSLIGRNILSILDPDRSRLVNFTLVNILRLNVGLLFLNNNEVRLEAMSRLCWLLSTSNAPNSSSESRSNSRILLPHLNNLHDKALAMVCQLDRKLDFKTFRSSTSHFYQPSSLHQVIDLLASSNIEPVIRRSAVTQISVMMEDPILHSTFLESNGLLLIKDLMFSALTENDYSNYPDSVIPCLSILKNLALYNAFVRQQLSQSDEYFICILRGIFMFCAEERIKQDGAVLLFLMTFCDYVHGSLVKNDMSIPYIIKTLMRCPFDSRTHWRTSEYTLEPIKKLKDNKWALTSLQIHWNIEWFNGLDKLLEPTLIKYEEKDDFSDLLKLSENDLLAIKSTSIENSLKKHLNTIHHSHNHSEIMENLHKLTTCLNLYEIVKSTVTNVSSMESFEWEKVFCRFLNAPPAGRQDNLLLAQILDFLCLLLPYFKFQTTKQHQTWITSILTSKTHYFNNLLATELVNDQEPDVDKLLNSLLELVNVCTVHEQCLFESNTSIQSTTTTTSLRIKTYPHIVKIIAKNLQCTNTQRFHNLAYLDRLLATLVNLTATLGWSESKRGEPPKKLLNQLCDCSFEFLSSFHCGKGRTASDSLMGLSISRNVVLVLNHLIAEMQHFNVQNWEVCFLGNEINNESTIESICELRHSRDVVLKAASINLLAGLAISPSASVEMIQDVNFRRNKVNVWKITLNILCDQEESSIVRENAALVLRNLSSHVVPVSGSESGYNLIQGLLPVKIKKLGKNTYEELSTESQKRILIGLIDGCNFFAETETILKRLYNEKVFNFHEFRRKYSPSATHSENLDDFMFVYKKTLEISNISDSLNCQTQKETEKFENIYSIVTTGLIKSLSMFVYNLIALLPEYICSQMQEMGLIKLLFKCVTLPNIEIEQTRDLMLYAEILEMNTAVCSLLARAANRNVKCLLTIGNCRDCLDIVTALFDPAIYIVALPQLLYLRNKLWSSVYNLLEVLLTGTGTIYASESGVGISKSMAIGQTDLEVNNINKYDTNVLIMQLETRKGPFFLSLCESINTDLSNDLQLSALNSLTSLLKCTSINAINTPPNTFQQASSSNDSEISADFSSPSIQSLLDNTKTPRTIETACRTNNNTINKFALLEELYFAPNIKLRKPSTPSRPSTPSTCTFSSETERDQRMAGAELCKILLELYEVLHLQQSAKITIKNKKKTIVLNTLTGLLLVSNEAKQFALEHGLLPKIIEQLRRLYIILSLESVDCLRRIADKKRLNPLMIELEGLLGLMTNFLYNNEDVKASAANFGLTDILHKLWPWLLVQKGLLIIGLKLLCTLTTNCPAACASLPLTSSIAGTGLRKTPSGSSLLHVLCALINKEMELVSRTHSLETLKLTFHILHNAVEATECRFIIVKNNFLQTVGKLHPQLTKRQKPWDEVEYYWLEFLNVFSLYPEGQTLIGKMQEVCDIVLALCGSPKSNNRLEALETLRNVAFHHGNKARLLGSDEFINVLSTKLTSGTLEEANIVITMIWAMAANSQKSKLTFRSAHLDTKLRDFLRVLHLSNYANIGNEEIERLHYVISLLTAN